MWVRGGWGAHRDDVKAQRCCSVWPAAHWLLWSRVMCRGPATARFATLTTWPLLAGTTMLQSPEAHPGRLRYPIHTLRMLTNRENNPLVRGKGMPKDWVGVLAQ